MKQLTDKKMALAFGWKIYRPKGWTLPFKYAFKPGTDVTSGSHAAIPLHQLPEWTKRLDVITAEIASRGLGYCIMAPNEGSLNWPLGKAKVKGAYSASCGTSVLHTADTAPLALCRALLAYLKERK